MLIFNMLHICHIEESDKKAVWLSAKLLADTNIFFQIFDTLAQNRVGIPARSFDYSINTIDCVSSGINQ